MSRKHLRTSALGKMLRSLWHTTGMFSRVKRLSDLQEIFGNLWEEEGTLQKVRWS